MSRPAPLHPEPLPRLRVDYVEDTAPAELLAQADVLAVLGFGDAAPVLDDPRWLRVPLQPYGAAPLEVWRGQAPVHHGRDGDIAWSTDGHLMFGAIEVDEPEGHTGEGDHSGILLAAEHAYRELTRFIGQSEFPHLLRIWNYLDAITHGDGDTERYRQFCVGRARGLGTFDTSQLPAATAIGRCDDARTIQVYWLAARLPGIPVENPRQVSAYQYPRQYGPQAPSFARAMLPPAGSAIPLMLSGTASVVGHASQHEGELLAQLDETFANFDALIASARTHRPDLPAEFGPGSRLKIYVRDAADLAAVAEAFDARFGDRLPRVVLHAAICRRELALEIDGVHDAG
ncbi:pteridine-dependent deoxygenase [Luteimonas terrae]|uniref:Chorismate lyase/3-hydroxybenzoate synthase n=1 Tax=Luteimonas terrae TaxID=1530191 RepID=A0ABU1XZN7_9GAMM|nr:pteridine-dependent deoxygenase [Luteimonas terrae]MDR7193551.1 chorismate lyase/3-hydroxybenzoate synthase [Luteimonas terrae]